MENNKNLLMVGITLFILASCGSSGADVDAVAKEMMTGKDPLSEKDAKCVAKNIKKNASDDQWSLMVKRANGEITAKDMTMEEAMGLMVPLIAASSACGVPLE